MRRRDLIFSRKERIYFFLFLITLLVGIGFRLPYLTIERLWPDEALYAWSAKRIFHHPSVIFSEEITGFHPPLFPLLLSLGHFFLPPESACRLITMLINVAGIVGIYFLGVKIRSRFLGVFCALCLSFHFVYFLQSFSILNDGVLAVGFIFLMLILLNVSAGASSRWDIYVGLMAAAIILLKWSGAIVILLVAGYYFFVFPTLSIRVRFKRMLTALGVPILTIILLFMNNKIQLGSWWPNVSALQGMYLVRPFWYYAARFHNVIIIPFLIPFFLYGLYRVWRDRNKAHILLVLWFIIFFAALSLTPEKDMRYTLPLIPSILLISGIGIIDLLSKSIKKENVWKAEGMVLLAVLIFFGITSQRMKEALEITSKKFVGFREAGIWIKREAASSPDALFVASSPRIIRYYSDINFQEFGGRLSAIPKTKDQFHNWLAANDTEVFLIVDYWERTQPSWIFPLTEENRRFLSDVGFRLIKRIDKNILSRNGDPQNTTVVWVFRKDK